MSVTIFHANLILQKCYRQTKAEYFKDAFEERGLTYARIGWRVIADKHSIRCRATEGIVLRQPAIIAWWWLVGRWRSLMPGSSWSIRWWIVPSKTTTMKVSLSCLGGTQQCLAIFDGTACLEVQLELNFSYVIAIGLRAHLALNVVGTENGLLNFHL